MSGSFKEKAKRGELILGFSVAQVKTPDIVLIVAASGYDVLWVDMEHTATSLETASALCLGAVAAGLTPIVRVQSHDPHDLTKILDTGALGIVVPHVDTAEEARRIVAACRFPPLGVRSVTSPSGFTRYRPLPMNEVLDLVNRETIITVMVESPESVENANEIAAVEGVDMLLVGPMDLTAEMGIVGQLRHERFLDAFKRVADACRAHKKVLGVAGIFDVAQLTELYAIGLRFINAGQDAGLLAQAARTRHDQVRAIAPKK
jgi:4-hydroxy-2-oxoheptanedioate aldolase